MPIGNATIFMADIAEPGMTEKLLAALGDKPTLILSDMAANTVGHKQTDHVRTVGLAEVGGAVRGRESGEGRHVRREGFPGRRAGRRCWNC